MYRLMIAIQIAACSGSPAVPDATEAVPVAHPVVHGAPGSAIDIIAATADGRAAVTQDGDGNTRLWPTLDGTAEPIVVRMATASAASTVTTVDLVSNNQRVVCSLTASTAQPQTGAIQQLPLGFIDDRTLACFAFGQVSWYPIAGGAPTFVHVAPQPELVAFGGERELSGEGTALGIAAEKSMQYLGYVAGEPTSVHDSPLGLMFLHGSEPPLVLDRALAVKAEIPLAPAFDDALPIDDAHVLRSDPALGKGFELALAEPGIHRSTKITTSTEYAIHFDAAAKLLVAAQAAHVAAFPYDSTHPRIGAPTMLDGPPGREFVTA